jgi:hypothetical protein
VFLGSFSIIVGNIKASTVLFVENVKTKEKM